ncbi:MAG: sensor histidine kinase [Pseudomonadota bacterium]|nr:sensor histidine kinase [Pseudomonadota bacterium]
MEIRSRHVYYLLGLTFLGMVLVAVSWEFVLEDLVVPVFYPGYMTESLFERWEYVVTSLAFATVALIVPGWVAVRSVAQSEHAREALNRAHDELALRVEQRTAELTKVNEQLRGALDERQRSEEALRKSEKELRLLSSRLLTAQENERQRVAHDLHDSVSQSLSALKFRVECILDKMDHGSKETPADLNDILVPLIQDAIEEVRNIYMGLRPSILDDLGIIATISWFCREFQTAYPHIRVQHAMDIEESDIPDGLKIVIFRVLQEALCNVARHSQADHVDISLLKKNASVEFTIQDNGMGFQLDEVVSDDHSDKGVGLSSMKERVELAGGSFHIQTGRGSGTLVQTSYPVSQV